VAPLEIERAVLGGVCGYKSVYTAADVRPENAFMSLKIIGRGERI
jgi:hypothetical protein